MATTRARPYKRVDAVSVTIWGKLAGAVALDPKYGYYAFAFDERFRRSGIDLAPLKMPAASSADPQIFMELPEATYKRLPAFLADALPDDFGNALVDRYMAENGISPGEITVLDRLAYMGSRSMGALEFRPQRGPRTRTATAIHLGSLVQEARKAVTGTIDDDDHANAALRSIIEVGTSAGGARAKAVIAWNRDTDEIRSGQAAVPPGFEHWLLKFDGMGTDKELGASADYGRIEYAYHLMAREAGIDMSESRLLHENGRSHFMTRRFDRAGGDTRHHIQTLCAMAQLDYKKKSANGYAQLFTTIKDLNLGHDALVEAYRRMAFNVMARNCDDHTKNFSFRLRQGESWELAPAYDVTFAHNPKGEWTSQHLMSVNGKFKDFTSEDLLAEADRFGVGEAKVVNKRVHAAVKAWPEFARMAGVGEKEIAHIGGLHCLL
ncbi:MAG: type II toxin-antitoxin system HipA family toxin [Noviherbaspirillum sp.]